MFFLIPLRVQIKLPASFPVVEHRIPCQAVRKVCHSVQSLDVEGHGLFGRGLYDGAAYRYQIKVFPCVDTSYRYPVRHVHILNLPSVAAHYCFRPDKTSFVHS